MSLSAKLHEELDSVKSAFKPGWNKDLEVLSKPDDYVPSEADMAQDRIITKALYFVTNLATKIAPYMPR